MVRQQVSQESLPVITTTAPLFFAGAANNTIRKRLLLKFLYQKGRISMNGASDQCSWNVEFNEPDVQSHGAAGEYTFSESDNDRQLTIDWRGYVATDKWDYKNYLMNNTTQGIINRYDRTLPRLRQSLDNNFHGEMYIDGYAANNEQRVHGLNSFLGDDGATVVGDLIALPSTMYGGKSTALQSEGGSWSTNLAAADRPKQNGASDWPDGNGTPNYDYLSPVLVNIGSTRWGATQLWSDNAGRILRRTTTWTQKNGGEDGKVTVYMLASDLWNGYQDYHEAKFRSILPHPTARDLGFPDVLNQDGTMVMFEFDTPAGEGYGINCMQMELESLDTVLFGTRGPHYDIKSDAYLFKAGFFGNAKYNPKYFSKLKNYADV